MLNPPPHSRIPFPPPKPPAMAGASTPPAVAAAAAASALRPTFLYPLPGTIFNAGWLRPARPNAGSVRAKMASSTLEYRKLGDSDLTVSEITIGTVLSEAFIGC